MTRRLRLESGEDLVISVTPVPSGVIPAVGVLVVIESLVIKLAFVWSLVHRYEGVVLAAAGALPAFLVVTRTWRWRSHKVILTTQRLISEGGVFSRYSTHVNLDDVVATHSVQSFSERVRRRGVVSMDTASGALDLPAVRHPAALRRLIDRTRREKSSVELMSGQEWLARSRGDHRESEDDE